MTSSFLRESMGGVIRQDRNVVGAICLPEDATQEFIDEFNHCYGPINLQIDLPAYLPEQQHPLLPVGARQPRVQLQIDTASQTQADAGSQSKDASLDDEQWDFSTPEIRIVSEEDLQP